VATGVNGSVVAGYTDSADFPIHTNGGEPVYDATHNGGTDAFTAFVNNGGVTTHSSFLGGSSWEHAYDVAVDGMGHVTVGGVTDSINFPLHRQDPRVEPAPLRGFLTRFADREPVSLGPQDRSFHVGNYAEVHGATRVISPWPDAASGKAVSFEALGKPRPPAPLADPDDYIELSVTGLSGGPYRVWMRGYALFYQHDSVWMQFDTSVDDDEPSQADPIYRIGTTSAMTMVLEDCAGCDVHEWGWQDNGYGRHILGPTVFFDAAQGETRIRIQRREEGIVIDQLVFAHASSPYFFYPPGYQKDDVTIVPETGAPTPGGSREIVVYTGVDSAVLAGTWRVDADATAAGGRMLTHPNANAPKVAAPLAAPASYAEFSVDVEPGVPYYLYLRGKAAANDPYNDSVYVQFEGSQFDVGTTSAVAVNIETCSGAGLQGWGWRSGPWCTGTSGAGTTVTFATGGTKRIRLQPREDGISIDQIVLSADRFATAPPGAVKNDATIVPR
jgi:hypothetical protein